MHDTFIIFLRRILTSKKLNEFVSGLHVKKEVVKKVLGELNETK